MNIPMQDYYPIPYFKDLFITAPQGHVFKFELLTKVLPEEDWLNLSPKERLRNVWEVSKEIESKLNIRMDINIIEDGDVYGTTSGFTPST